MKLSIFEPDYITIPFRIVKDKRLDQSDRMLYGIVYWYEHMKDGRCFASNETMARILGTTARVVQNSLTRLENCGYIKREYKDESKRNRLEIKSLIAFKYVSSMDDTKKTNDPQMIDVSPIDDTAYDLWMTRVIKGNKNSDKDSAPTSGARGERSKFNHQGGEVIKAFESFNPSVKKYYNNTTQRKSCDRLIELHGLEKILKVIAILPKTNTIPYIPTITTPLQLEEKWSALESAMLRKKAEYIAKTEKYKVAFT